MRFRFRQRLSHLRFLKAPPSNLSRSLHKWPDQTHCGGQWRVCCSVNKWFCRYWNVMKTNPWTYCWNSEHYGWDILSAILCGKKKPTEDGWSLQAEYNQCYRVTKFPYYSVYSEIGFLLSRRVYSRLYNFICTFVSFSDFHCFHFPDINLWPFVMPGEKLNSI